MADKVKIEITGCTEIAFSFDTTGSMSPCLRQVREVMEETVEKMFEDIPGLKLAFIAHGDYCDGAACMKILKMTDDKTKVYDFIRHAPSTGGGDAEECYELALHEARSLGWTDGIDSGRALVLIGDDLPHPPDYHLNKQKLDWTSELIALKEIGVIVYPLQCLYNPGRQAVNQFWSQIAELSGSALLKLADFKEAAHNLMGVGYAAAGEKAYALYEAGTAGMAFSSETTKNTDAMRKEAKKFTAARHLGKKKE